MSVSTNWKKYSEAGFNTTAWQVSRKNSKMWMGGCVTGYVAVSGNNGRNPNEDGKTWYVWALTLNTHTATAVAEWVHGRSPVALFWKPPSRWNVCNNAVTNLCLLIIRKLLHFLTNRCIREPYVQWCERLSPSAKAGGAVYSIGGSFFIQFSLIPPLILLQLQDYQKVFQSMLMSSWKLF